MRRRDFLKASTVGAGMSLLDGCSSPEEQFIVQRVRQTRELPGETVWRPGVCRQCSAACGIQVRVVDGNAKKIEGNEAHPVNRGGVCALGHSLLQELYNPDRLLRAQRRVGNRGEGLFEEVAWDEAVAATAEAISAAPSDQIAIVAADRAGLVGALWRRFAEALGAPPPTFVEAPELEVERRAAQISLGVDDLPYFDIQRAECVLSIGAPILDRWRSPVHYTRAFAEMRRGRATRRGRLIQAEARMSLTAANADEWLPIRPGTEGMFARTVAGLLLAEGSVAPAASRRYRVIFPDDPPTLAEGASVCDVAEERIRQVARDLADADGAVAIGGGSAAAHTNGLFNVVAALGLNLLLDNLGRPGGVYAPTRLGLARGVAPAGAAETSAAELVARLRGESGSPVQVLLVAEADPVHAVPGGWGLAEALANVGTIVALSSFRDDTTLHADLVLPIATELERLEAVEPAASVGVPVLGLAEPVVQPLGDGVHPADVLLSVAAALGEPVAGRFPWADFESLVEERVEQDLSRLPGGSGTTASAYLSAAFESGGVFGAGSPTAAPAGPSAPAPTASVGRFDGPEAEYPFVLLPFESVKTADGRGANRPWLQEHPDPLSTVMWNAWLELSPADAQALGVGEGDRLLIESPAGSIEAHAVLDPSVRPGVVAMPLGYGHREYGRYARGRGTNVLDLVGATQVDGTSAPAWAATRVRIGRLGPGELVRFGRSYEDRGEGEVIPVGWAPHVPVRREASV